MSAKLVNPYRYFSRLSEVERKDYLIRFGDYKIHLKMPYSDTVETFVRIDLRKLKKQHSFFKMMTTYKEIYPVLKVIAAPEKVKKISEYEVEIPLGFRADEIVVNEILNIMYPSYNEARYIVHKAECVPLRKQIVEPDVILGLFRNPTFDISTLNRRFKMEHLFKKVIGLCAPASGYVFPTEDIVNPDFLVALPNYYPELKNNTTYLTLYLTVTASLGLDLKEVWDNPEYKVIKKMIVDLYRTIAKLERKKKNENKTE